MDKSIYQRQNDREILLLQKAQRNQYTLAKRSLYSGLFLSIVGTSLFAILMSFYSSETLNALSSFTAILVFAFNCFLNKKVNKNVELAAKIQQTIDVSLFQLPDNCHVLLPSEISEIVASYVSAELSEFKNWYNNYSSLDFSKQIFFSQKENIRWDQKLRDKYSNILIFMAIVSIILNILYAIFNNISLVSFFAITSWLFPLEQFFITQWLGLRGDMNYLKTVNEEFRSIEKCYEKYSESEIKCKLCEVQTSIFEHRKKSILIPDWFYKIHQNMMQRYEDGVAAEHIRKN